MSRDHTKIGLREHLRRLPRRRWAGRRLVSTAMRLLARIVVPHGLTFLVVRYDTVCTLRGRCRDDGKMEVKDKQRLEQHSANCALRCAHVRYVTSGGRHRSRHRTNHTNYSHTCNQNKRHSYRLAIREQGCIEAGFDCNPSDSNHQAFSTFSETSYQTGIRQSRIV